ncbi:15830_t:CDS:2 [Cetraspora pellucida]|uniref:15830_t:CDS:1 n=1 Tax=Cetraspora pellucida TaxID=1433469 RepID=A0A9N8VGD7_9GLOM|nr:15830_t:CDS:2 [Cetraspora pellucida]
MQRYIVASQINVAPSADQVARREEAFELVISYLVGPALNCAENGDNQIGGLNTVREFYNKAGAEIGRIGAGVATADGEPTDNAPVTPNAGRGFSAITIASGIKLKQLLYLFSTFYMMVKHLKQMAVFGQLMQEDMGVEEFFTRIKKVGKLARMIPEQQKEQLIHGLNPMNQYNIQMMVKFKDTLENITRALAEAEKFTLSQRNAPSSLSAFSAANPYIDTNNSGITKTEIVDLIKTAMTFSESQTAQQNADLHKKSSKKRAEDTAINRFLSDLLRKNPGKHFADEYDYNPIEDISDSLAGLTLNSVIKTAVRCAVKKSSGHKCSICRRLEHNSRNCSQKKKKRSKKSKKSKVNIATVDSNSDSGTSSNTSSSDSSDSDTSSEDFSDSGVKQDSSFKKSSFKKTSKTSLEETIRKVLQSELKLIFSDHFSQDPIKANILNQVPLIQEKIESPSNTSLITEIVSLDLDEKKDLDGPIEIDFVKKKKPKTSVTTVKYKIKHLKIPAMTVNSEAKPLIITKNIVIHIEAKIDKSETHDLSSIATVPVESVGVVRKLPIILDLGCTIYKDFIVVKYQKLTLIFSN